jgi:hypothetical protein
MKKQLIEEILRFKKLSGVLLNENSGEKALADIVIARLVKTGEKSLPKEIGTFTTTSGTKGVLSADGYRSLLTKSVLSAEEKKTLHSINKNIVREIGIDVFVTAIKDVTKNMGRLEAVALENKIINEFFDATTGNTLKSSLNIGSLKPEIELDIPEFSIAPPVVIDDILTVGQKNQIRKEMDDFVQGNLDYNTINQVSKEDLSKISQIQKLKENDTGLKLLEEKAKLEKELMVEDRKLKELTIKEKEIDIKLKQDKGNVELQKEKQGLKKLVAETWKARLGILWELRWLIIGVIVFLVGWKAVLPVLKNILTGKSALDGVLGGSSGSGGSSGKKSMSDY